MLRYSSKYVKEATEDDPTGWLCSVCLCMNFNADDCGWWYWPRPVCYECIPWEEHHGER